jgi:hypothetical protein
MTKITIDGPNGPLEIEVADGVSVEACGGKVKVVPANYPSIPSWPNWPIGPYTPYIPYIGPVGPSTTWGNITPGIVTSTPGHKYTVLS